MPKLISEPAVISAPGHPPKLIQEFVGHVRSQTAESSVAWMKSPAGWSEPGQTPEFNEYTVVLKGVLHVESRQGLLKVKEGQSVIAEKGEWVRYSTPEGAEYIAVCVPAFSPALVHRDSV